MADAKKSRIGLYVIIAMAVIMLFVVLYFGFKEGGWFRGAACDSLRNGFDTKGNPNPKCKFNNPAITGEPSPSGTSGWVSDLTFPIKKGSWGAKVAAIQKALGLPEGKCSTCADGKFGPYTEGKLKAKTGKTEIATQAEYDDIVNTKGTTTVDAGGKNFQQLKTALGSSANEYSAGVYVDVQGNNKNYVFSFWPDGQFFFSLPKVQTSIAGGTYSDGGKRMKVDGDLFAYTEGSVKKNMDKITKELGE